MGLLRPQIYMIFTFVFVSIVVDNIIPNFPCLLCAICTKACGQPNKILCIERPVAVYNAISMPEKLRRISDESSVSEELCCCLNGLSLN